jgi:F-type H+-transporting ATPase subunit a
MVISNKPLRFIIAILIACLPFFCFANTEVQNTPVQTETTAAKAENTTKVVDELSEIKEKIDEKKAHHVLDAHEFSILEDESTGVHYGFPLPIILWDNGIQIFSSSKFNHGESVAESNGNYYKLGHNEKIYKTDDRYR